MSKSGHDNDAPPQLTPVEENVWYVVASLYRESEHQHVMNEQSRRAWNLLTRSGMGEIEISMLRKCFSEWSGGDDPFTGKSAVEIIEGDFKDISEAIINNIQKDLNKKIKNKNDLFLNRFPNFENCYFKDRIYFTNMIFCYVSFANAFFAEEIEFEGCIFLGACSFENVNISSVWMRNCYFVSASFNGAKIGERLLFKECKFGSMGRFSGLKFTKNAVCQFWKCEFEFANFTKCVFGHESFFVESEFRGSTEFDQSEFLGPIDFSGSKFTGRLSFARVEFFAPPKFFNATLDEGTNWFGVQWPEAPHSKKLAIEFVDGYIRLRNEMERLKKHEDELKFFALELQARQVLEGDLYAIAIQIYGALSDYGRSFYLPLEALLFCIGFGADLGMILNEQHFSALTWWGISAANTLAPFGFRRELLGSAILEKLSTPMILVAAVQTIVGVVLLFLFGLAARNRFRMR